MNDPLAIERRVLFWLARPWFALLLAVLGLAWLARMPSTEPTVPRPFVFDQTGTGTRWRGKAETHNAVVPLEPDLFCRCWDSVGEVACDVRGGLLTFRCASCSEVIHYECLR